MMGAHLGVDLPRQRLKTGLAGFCYPTCSEVSLGKEKLLFDQNRTEAEKENLFLT